MKKIVIFPENLPFGVFKKKKGKKQRCGVAIGEYVLDLKLSSKLKLFENHGKWTNSFKHENLNKFMSRVKPNGVKQKRNQNLLQNDNSILTKDLNFKKRFLYLSKS